MKDKKPFKYHRPPADTFKKQAERSSGSWDRILKDGFKEFRPKDGDHKIRLMPPTFEGATHYAMDIYVHKNVGPDNQTYLCLKKMQQEDCPVCEEYVAAKRGGDDKYAGKIRVNERRLAWIIDRKNEDDGPQLYDMPFPKHEKRICAVAQDPDTGETLYLYDPDEGYDVTFHRETVSSPQGAFPEYTNHQASRKKSPLARDEATQEEWLEYIQEHPLNEVLQFFSYDHIKDSFAGAVSKKEDAEDDDGPATRDGSHEKARKEFSERVDKRGSTKAKPKDDDDDDKEEPRGKGKGSRIQEPADEDTDNDDDDEPAPRKSKTKAAADDDDDDDEKPTRAKTAARSQEDSDDDTDDDDDEKPAAKKSAKAQDDDDDDTRSSSRSTASRNGDAKAARKSKEDDDADEDDDDDEPAPSARRERLREGLRKAKV